MDTDKRKELMVNYLSGELSFEQKEVFEKSMANNPKYQKELEELTRTWERLQQLHAPEPTQKMDTRFYEMLHGHTEKRAQKLAFSFDSLLALFTKNNKQWLYRLAILVVGLGIGYTVNFNSKHSSTKLAQEDAKEVRESLVLTLLEQPSATKRLQAFNETNKLKTVNKTIVEALLKTLNNDSNVNVRLAAIESLLLFADDPFVREGLVKSIVHQTSPLVQVTIAQLMVALQEKDASIELKKLLEKEDLNSSVREELEKSVKSLI